MSEQDAVPPVPPSNNKSIRRELLAALATVLIAFSFPSIKNFLADAISSDPPAPPPFEVVADAGPKVASTGSVSVEIFSAGPPPSGAATAPSSMRGSIDTKANTSAMTGAVDSLGTQEGKRSVEALRIGTALYLRTPRVSEMGSVLQPWVVIDIQQLSGNSPGPSYLDQLEALDSTGEISSAVYVSTYFFGSTNEILSGGIAGIVHTSEKMGREQIRGVPTTQYHLTLDQQRVQQQTLKELRDPAVELRADAWVDEEGRLRRYRLTVASEPSATTSMTHEFFDFGRRPNIGTPPAAEVISLRELIEEYSAKPKP